MKTLFRLVSLVGLALIPRTAGAQLVTGSSVTPEEALIEHFKGQNVEVSNITFSGNLSQIGSFNSAASNVGIGSGIILASGDVEVAIGPNDQGGAGLGGGNFGSGDVDLTTLSTFSTNDAAILEFDFVPTRDWLEFRYVFGSEEYNEYVCGSVSDAFGFFLSGPGILGPFANNAVNLAVIPDAFDPAQTLPVTINTVNNGQAGFAGDASNCAQISPNWNLNAAYFVDNENNADPNSVQMDGMTVVLTASAPVQCGETHHIKIAIADAGDTAFDSVVFLEGGSFTATGTNCQALASCDPFPDLGDVSFGYEPDGVTTQLETAQVGAAYGDALHIRWPSFATDIIPDTPLDAPIDSVLVSAASLVDVATGDTLSLETVGLSLDCAQMEVEPVPDCAFLGGEDACLALSGIPQLPGEFLLLLEVDMWATVFGFPLATPWAFPGWPLTISSVPTPVTFRVDMGLEDAISPNGVFVAGSFQGWTPGESALLDPDGDLVYEGTFDLLPGDHEFKFINGNNWGGDGDGNIDNENPPDDCTVNGNRPLAVGLDPLVIEYCYNTCDNECQTPLPTAPITFQVDMEDEAVSPQGVWLLGDMTTSDGQNGIVQMVDANADGVYQATLAVSGAEQVLYRFVNGQPGSAGAEEEMGMLGEGGCAVPNGFGGFNRIHLRSGAPEVLPVACFGSCLACNALDTVTVELALEAEAWMEAEGYSALFVEGDWPGAEQGGTGFGQNTFGSEALFQIPDNQTQCFSQGVNVTGYPEEAILEGGVSLDAIAVNMEHSFMGDLTITMICPNGSSIRLHQQGGGGTFLGVPLDNDATPDVPGVGYDYTWSSAASNGTWANNAGGTLPSGSYESAQPWTLLEGCPLNGGWTLEVCDSWGSDNGFIFSWGVQFSEAAAVTPNVMELDPNDGFHKLHLELAVQDVEAGFGFDVLALDEAPDFPVLELELVSSTCGVGDRARHFPPADLSALSEGDTVRYAHQPTGLVHCAGQCEPCAWPGCTDQEAENFNPEASLDDGSCSYPPVGCAEIGDEGWADLLIGFYPGSLEAVFGVDSTWEVAFNLPPLVSDGTGPLFQALSFDAVTWAGWPPGTWSGDPAAEVSVPGGTQSCVVLSGLPTEAGTYTLTLTGTLVVSIFGSPFAIEDYVVPLDITVLENPNPIQGCVYLGADNFSPIATLDDGSCILAGCMDPSAINHSPVFNEDDGSCLYSDDVSGPECPADLNGDDLVGVADLLILLGEFDAFCTP